MAHPNEILRNKNMFAINTDNIIKIAIAISVIFVSIVVSIAFSIGVLVGSLS